MNNDNVRTVGFQFEPEPVRETGTSSSYLDDILRDEKGVFSNAVFRCILYFLIFPEYANKVNVYAGL